MGIKILAGLMATLLFAGYLLPYVFKMKDVALGIVVVAGLAMMATDLWQSLKSKDD
jgi:ABC-type iron transport system FetAB permease component